MIRRKLGFEFANSSFTIVLYDNIAWSNLPYQSNSEFCSLAKPRIAVSVFSTNVICVTVAITCEMFFVVFSVFFAAGFYFENSIVKLIYLLFIYLLN